ncbi:MAG: hypothetical protein ACK41E_05190 [Deinococcales bacterium]
MTDAVFDLAVNRAHRLVQRVGWAYLPVWHSRTRFVARVPLEDIVIALKNCPNAKWVWRGGRAGGWYPSEYPLKGLP